VLERTGLPAIIRPSFTLGGTGGGIAYNKLRVRGDRRRRARRLADHRGADRGIAARLEGIRDGGGARPRRQRIIICSIENVDPMGVHTGDSITVAPALTLTDKEYQIMRNAEHRVLREIGVETGGSNVQFAVNPKDGRLIVIEMNPRVSAPRRWPRRRPASRSPSVAAKLAVGYTLDEITNEITGATPASFEPTIDYVVTKIPRFAFEKFKGAKAELTTAMKSVGEVMAIGRNFKESVQKALRGLETGLDGFNRVVELEGASRDQITAALAKQTPDRLLNVAQALREGFTVEEVQAITHYDPWFLRHIEEIVARRR
jgi:carbamoyl-phosphate synthase large subunit